MGSRLAKQGIHIDIDLTRRPKVTNLKAVGLEAVFHQADFLDADHFLFLSGMMKPEEGGVQLSAIEPRYACATSIDWLR
jgi:hypothetical protein